MEKPHPVSFFSLWLPVVAWLALGRAEGRRLNRQFRKKDYATIVLSFHSGDLVLCHPVVVREAREQGKTVRAHYAHLVVHGMLHLRGLKHGKGMEAREIRLLRHFGFRNPYTLESAEPE